jgi:hypothetical protein
MRQAVKREIEKLVDMKQENHNGGSMFGIMEKKR